MQEKIYLRPLCLNDVSEKYLSWVNDPYITEYLGIGKKCLKYQDLVKYVEDSPKNGRYNFAVITKNSKNHIGNCSIYSINQENKKFEIGWFIGDKNFWGGHYSTMVIFYLHKIGFLKMGLKKCIGYVDKKHVKARMTNKFAGYKEIGRENRRMEKENITTTNITLEITKREWLANAKKLHVQYPELYII